MTPVDTTASSSAAAAACAVYDELKDASSPPPHYFAFGAMMNPVSVRNRNLQLERGQPAEILDHQLVFYGCHGFAEIVPRPGSSVHGVVYPNVPCAQMKELDHIEHDYVRKPAQARLYGQEQKTMEVSVYCRPPEECEDESNDRLPSERYLQVLAEGAKHYGVDPNYIQFLQKHPCRPRPAPSEYLTFEYCAASNGNVPRKMTRQEVRASGTGLNGNPFYLTCGEKVIEFRRTPSNEALVDEFVKTFSEHGDRHVELCMSLLLYDPIYGCPSCLEEVTPEHGRYREHMMCEIIQGLGQKENWKMIAMLVD